MSAGGGRTCECAGERCPGKWGRWVDTGQAIVEGIEGDSQNLELALPPTLMNREGSTGEDDQGPLPSNWTAVQEFTSGTRTAVQLEAPASIV